jgi:hypothetical protein
MRDAWFHPFPIRMNSDFNKVEELSLQEQEHIMSMHAISKGATVTPTSTVSNSGKTPIGSKNSDKELTHELPEDEEEPVNNFPDEEIDLAGWVLGYDKD